ncbi:MAG: replication initiation protein [Aquificota bacterium]|nr:replication initiation protein [Aquificota bacterium]
MEEVEARVVDWDNEKVENNKITKANALIEARYRLTIREQRLILMCISLLSPGDEELPTVRMRVKDLIEALELDSHSFYDELKQTLKRLLSRVLEIPEENGGYTLLHWVETARYIPEVGEVVLRLNPELKPYLLKLKEKFTTYYLKAVIGLRSSYSVRLYELLKQYQGIGRRRFTIEELRSILKIQPDEYTRYNDFKRFVILQAQRELKEKTDIYFDFREIKRGRKVVELEFTILENPKFKALKEKEESAKTEEERERLRKRYEELLQKWEPYLEKLSLRRLSKAHAVFFLENSLLEPEQTLEAMKG